MIAAIVLTKNEEQYIRRCLDSLRWCDEIIVIDDYSEDKTLRIAEKYTPLRSSSLRSFEGARIFRRKSNDDFSSQRNFGLEKAKSEWVLFVDADEEISPRLALEIRAKTSEQCLESGFTIVRKDKSFNRWLKYGETGKIRVLRLAKKDAGLFKGKVHEKWQIKGKIGALNGKIIHNRFLKGEEFIKKIDFYSSIRAAELYKQGYKASIFSLIAYPSGKFLLNFVVKKGFLDGMPGFIMAFFMSLHSLLVRVKLYLLWQEKSSQKYLS